MGVLLWKDLQLSFGLGSNARRISLASNRRCKKGLRTPGRWLWPLGRLTWRELPVQVEDFRTSTTGHHHEKSSANDTDRVLKNEAAEWRRLDFLLLFYKKKAQPLWNWTWFALFYATFCRMAVKVNEKVSSNEEAKKIVFGTKYFYILTCSHKFRPKFGLF